jgi:hypothetical protein
MQLLHVCVANCAAGSYSAAGKHDKLGMLNPFTPALQLLPSFGSAVFVVLALVAACTPIISFAVGL